MIKLKELNEKNIQQHIETYQTLDNTSYLYELTKFNVHDNDTCQFVDEMWKKKIDINNCYNNLPVTNNIDYSDYLNQLISDDHESTMVMLMKDNEVYEYKVVYRNSIFNSSSSSLLPVYDYIISNINKIINEDLSVAIIQFDPRTIPALYSKEAKNKIGVLLNALNTFNIQLEDYFLLTNFDLYSYRQNNDNDLEIINSIKQNITKTIKEGK